MNERKNRKRRRQRQGLRNDAAYKDGYEAGIEGRRNYYPSFHNNEAHQHFVLGKERGTKIRKTRELILLD